MKVATYEVFRRIEPNLVTPITIHISPAEVFTDIGRWPTAEFVEELACGRPFTTELQEGMLLQLWPWGIVVVGKIEHWAISTTEFVKEIHDVVSFLKGEPTSGDILIDVLRRIVDRVKSPELVHELNAAYQNVPEHRRQLLLGHMDYKDHPIRAIIDGSFTHQQLLDVFNDTDMEHLRDPAFRPISDIVRRLEDIET